MEQKVYNVKHIRTCNNCGKIGHDYKKCPEPKTSYGIILVKIDKDKPIIEKTDEVDIQNITEITINSLDDFKKFGRYISNISFLLVSRKYSLGYTDFIRGLYAPDNVFGIMNLFQQMMENEIELIKKSSFDELWNEFWTEETKKEHLEKEYSISKEKFRKLKEKDCVNLNLEFYVNNIKCKYKTPEWGFPKGRRIRDESDIQCALREFHEETGYTTDDIQLISSVAPIIENITGTDGINYRHIYFLAEAKTDKLPKLSKENKSQLKEIGDIGFFVYDNAIQKIRDYHIEKKEIIKKITYFIINNILKNG
jgi:8-oxo-dGTP pyrophosphatase MutT (NUDIX family)